MAITSQIEESRRKISEFSNKWHSAKVSIPNMSDLPENAVKAVEVIDTTLSMVEKIIDGISMLLKMSISVSDIWKISLQSAIELIEGFIKESASIHFISLPPIVIVPPDKFVESAIFPQKISRYYDVFMGKYGDAILGDYINPVTNLPVKGLKAYTGEDLGPFFNVLRDSILDMGDLNAPRFGRANYAMLTAVVSAGSSVLDLFSLAGTLKDVKLFCPSVNNTFRIDAYNTENGISVKFNSDSILKILVPLGLPNNFPVRFSSNPPIGLSNNLSDLRYYLYRFANAEGDKSAEISSGTLLDLFKSNWLYADDKAPFGKTSYYKAFIYASSKLVLESNQTSAIRSVQTTVPSTPPNWGKVSIERLLFGEENVNRIFGLLSSIVDTLSSISKSVSSSLSGMLDSISGMIGDIRDNLNHIKDILTTISNILKALGSIKAYAYMSTGSGNYRNLIEHYREILVEKPPKNVIIKDNKSVNIVYVVSAVATTPDAMQVIKALSDIFSVSQDESRDLAETAIGSMQERIEEFNKWLSLLGGSQVASLLGNASLT